MMYLNKSYTMADILAVLISSSSFSLVILIIFLGLSQLLSRLPVTRCIDFSMLHKVSEPSCNKLSGGILNVTPTCVHNDS